MTGGDFRTVAIVVVNYASADLLRENLAPLARSARSIEVVVVDNFSTAVERADVISLASAENWRTVLPTSNLGFGAGMNAGVELAQSQGAEFLLLLNPDGSSTRRAFASSSIG